MILELMIALSVGAGLFGVGLYGALSQTNLVMILMGVELILAAALVNIVAFWRYLHPDEPAAQMFVLIVMAVIPFGLIGTIWGHVHFGLAMSLFTIIGLIGMSGIIINDAIVLVTTVQDYAARMPILQAAISGTRDRLRPILLTTLTTVLGLAPLMYEESRQSMFLKPTVVTLVYGLSVGFFIVLLMIPSLLVIQADVAKAFASLRRLAGGRRVVPGLRASLAVAGLAILGLELALFLPWAGSGTLPAWVRSLAGPLPPAVGLTLAGMLGAAVIAAAWFAFAGRGRVRAAGAWG